MRIEVFGQSIPDCDKTLHVVLAQAVDLPHAETQREGIVCGSAACSIPPPRGEVGALRTCPDAPGGGKNVFFIRMETLSSQHE
jgi:hypothetical protein